MSEEKVLCSHELVIRFDQLEGNRVNWYASPDDQVFDTRELSLIDLAECGAPLSAIGIRALWKLCADGLIHNSLEQANSIKEEVNRRTRAEPIDAFAGLDSTGVTIN